MNSLCMNGNLGNAYDSLGDYQKAIDFHSQHNDLAQAIGDKKGIAIAIVVVFVIVGLKR